MQRGVHPLCPGEYCWRCKLLFPGGPCEGTVLTVLWLNAVLASSGSYNISRKVLETCIFWLKGSDSSLYLSFNLLWLKSFPSFSLNRSVFFFLSVIAEIPAGGLWQVGLPVSSLSSFAAASVHHKATLVKN